MKYPVIKTVSPKGQEYEAYEAKIGENTLLVDKSLADIMPEGPEAFVDNEVAEMRKHMEAA